MTWLAQLLVIVAMVAVVAAVVLLARDWIREWRKL